MSFVKIYIITIAIALCGIKVQSQNRIDSLNKFKVGTMQAGPTKYKSGFVYYDSRGVKNTLLKWTRVTKPGTLFYDHDEYRWRVKMEFCGVIAYGWTDDCWIDLYMHKAYLNEQLHKIVYYDTTVKK